MRKGLILLGAVVVFAMSASSSVFAYDGGGGFPPGYTGNPHAPDKLVCNFVIKELPMGMSVWLPRCKVVKVTATAVQMNEKLSDRINKFLTRLRLGHE